MNPNVLLITLDDMSYDCLGAGGCPVDDVTPNMDRLGSEGLRFVHSHTNIAVCQPCRSVLMTGRYPHRNGAMGFEPMRTDVPTLQEQLHRAGYLQGIIGKTSHLSPLTKLHWDFFVRTYVREDAWGRSPDAYHEYSRSFFKRAAAGGKPFFLMVNSHDPHRPFVGAAQEMEVFGHHTEGRRRYEPDEIVVPGFLPDLPGVRRELAEYFSSVHRADEFVGRVLEALEESGMAGDTLVVFMSDHGMPFPFAKTNCYLASTRVPWIVRWPGRVRPGQVDSTHLVSGIDFMPTLLEALGLPAVDGMDGRSFLPLLQGGDWQPNEDVFTMFNTTSAKRDFPMRCIQTPRFGYIYNAWSDGRTRFQNESMQGLTYPAMKEAAADDASIARRIRMFEYRVREEIYDFANDPNGLDNLVDEPEVQGELADLRKRLEARMRVSEDPLLERYLQDVAR